MSAPVYYIALTAGGTGGHVFPAGVLAGELLARGHRVVLITDERGKRYTALFSGVDVEVLELDGFGARGLRGRLKALGQLVRGTRRAHRMFRSDRPDAVVGFGGYPSAPAMIAAIGLDLPTCLHEQNAVLGRVNRFLGHWAKALALSFGTTRRVGASARAKAVVTGNPVRADIAALSREPFPAHSTESMMRLLVLGGSQGARVLADVVPAALAALAPAQRRRLQVTQQCRREDLARVRAAYQDAGIAAETAEFIDDVPDRLAWAHLVIARAGASTVAEITAAGRPSILVPLPIATDDHQTANASELAEEGAGWLVPQAEFTPAALAKRLQKLLFNPARLDHAATRARVLGRPGAARNLADLIEWLARASGAGRPPASGRAPA
jgi:UDP-N-acetylglucosamine--N-acetylmuramyl-(pentapeptide) pyrophosphoryl-undecaprenol N-acetylglucosamine transferase